MKNMRIRYAVLLQHRINGSKAYSKAFRTRSEAMEEKRRIETRLSAFEALSVDSLAIPDKSRYQP